MARLRSVERAVRLQGHARQPERPGKPHEGQGRGGPAPAGQAQVGRVYILLSRPVLREVMAHAAADTTVERAGVLLGQVSAAGDATFVWVDAWIPARRTVASRVSVTFTADTWELIAGQHERDYPDRVIVGWYHSHPGFGIFLSGHDRFIHRHFFAEPWHVALVVDPLQRTHGCFGRAGNDRVQPLPVVLVPPEPASEGEASEADSGKGSGREPGTAPNQRGGLRSAALNIYNGSGSQGDPANGLTRAARPWPDVSRWIAPLVVAGAVALLLAMVVAVARLLWLPVALWGLVAVWLGLAAWLAWLAFENTER